MVSSQAIIKGIPQVDDWSTGPLGFGASQLICFFLADWIYFVHLNRHYTNKVVSQRRKTNATSRDDHNHTSNQDNDNDMSHQDDD